MASRYLEGTLKQIISISLESSDNDYEFETEFLGQDFNIKRFGTDGDTEKAAEMLLEWDNKADAIGLGGMKFQPAIEPKFSIQKKTGTLEQLSAKVQTPVTMGSALRNVSNVWTVRVSID